MPAGVRRAGFQMGPVRSILWWVRRGYPDFRNFNKSAPPKLRPLVNRALRWGSRSETLEIVGFFETTGWGTNTPSDAV
jgi:hypothetical protein